MSEILNTYPVFERNQVLTSTQLNNLVNYLDQQNRLTRASLIGMGVVCGLEVSYDAVGNTITISKGTGITSEGYLIILGECVTVKYRPYNLPPGTIYEPFVDSNNKQDIILYELLTDKAKVGSEAKKLDNATFLNDKVVLLFIESFDKDLKSCLGKSCDELGKDRILTLRKLLISKTDLQKVWSRTNTGKSDAIFPEKFKLPVVNLPRILFNPDNTHSTDYKEFSKNYANAVLTVFDKIIDALSETYDIYRPLMLKSYGENNPFTNNPVTGKLVKLQNFLNDSDATLTSYLGVQYVYDLFQDLIQAYNEFKNSAFDLMSECCADMSRFPKHLMLGEAISPALTLCEQSEYRHYFVQPPIYNLQKLLIQRTIAQHNRIVLMLESFDLKRANGFKGADLKSFPVKITPSLEKTTLLSLRSIPWYFDVKKKSSYSALGTIKNYWNFDVSRKCIPETEGLVLNYDDQSNDQSVAKDKLATPLFYDIQDYSFLRIEGQIGADFNLVLDRINKLKAQFNLPFNTVALQLDTNAGTLALDYRCGFEDIQEEYNMLKYSFCGFVNDIREIYSFVEKNQENLFDNKAGDDTSELKKKIEEILGILNKMCESMPDCFSKFDFADFQKGYKILLSVIIDFVLIDLKVLEKIKINAKDADKQIPLINGLIQRLSPLANRIVDLLFYNRFLRLYYSFKRRDFYMKKTTGVFSNYIRKQPGIDHQAGVQKGGTFILVYESSAKNGVIADFNLPYLCCTTDNCVPMCDDSKDGFVFELEPFARPDYAITLVGIPVDIDVMRNDYHLVSGNFGIKSDEVSKFGGIIEQNSENGPLRYLPQKGFSGTDIFSYTLFDEKTGSFDTATVTVVVKKPEEIIKSCYTVEILQCWGDQSVMETLRIRGIQFAEGDKIFELLLSDLQKTGGFTEGEIKGNVLENGERRRALLNCIGIPNNENTTYQQLGQLILDYQKSNCGAVQPAKECYTVEILQCWGDEAVKDALNQRQIEITATANMFELLLNDLRKTGGFTETEIKSNILESEERRRKLLSCLGIKVGPNTTYQQLGEMILDFQKSNCGAVQPTKECYTVAVLQCWGDDAVKDALNQRQIEITATANMFELLLNDLRKTGGFTNDEITSSVLEDPERRRGILKCLGIPFDVATTYEQLGQLIIDYQKSNCGAVQPTKECYTVGILQCWGDDAVKDAVTQRELDLSSGANMFEVLLTDLRKTGGFTNDEITSSILEDPERRRGLLKCLGIPFDVATTYEQLGQLILDYQKSNCGRIRENRPVAVDMGILPVNDLVKVLEIRGIVANSSETKENIEKALTSSPGGNALSESEMMVLSRDSIANILETKNIIHTTRENKSQLIKKLFNRG